MDVGRNHIWFYAMDSARYCARRDRKRYRVYAYLSPWGGWSYTTAPVGSPLVRDQRGTR
jgi:hypothetical protein